MSFHGISTKVQFSELIGKSVRAEVYANNVETGPIHAILPQFCDFGDILKNTKCGPAEPEKSGLTARYPRVTVDGFGEDAGILTPQSDSYPGTSETRPFPAFTS